MLCELFRQQNMSTYVVSPVIVESYRNQRETTFSFINGSSANKSHFNEPTIYEKIKIMTCVVKMRLNSIVSIGLIAK